MVKIILYGTPLSCPVRAVILTCKAIGLEFDRKEVNLLSGEHKTEEYLKLNPQHTIPTVIDDGKAIWDSHAICTYLISKYAKDDSLYPKDLYKRAQIDQRLHFDSGILYVRLRAISEGLILGTEPVVSSEKVDAIYRGYDFVEKFLEKDLYMVGNTLTVADFCCIATITSTQGLAPAHKDKYPKLNAWIDRLAELPYYEEANGKGARNVIEFYDSKRQKP